MAVLGQVGWRRGAGSALPQRVQARWQCSGGSGGAGARGRCCCSAWRRGGQHSGRSGGAGAWGRRCRSAWRHGGSAQAGRVAQGRGVGAAAVCGGAAAAPRQAIRAFGPRRPFGHLATTARWHPSTWARSPLAGAAEATPRLGLSVASTLLRRRARSLRLCHASMLTSTASRVAVPHLCADSAWY